MRRYREYVTDWTDYSAETRAALAIVSQGSCYFPGCNTPIMVFVGDRPIVNVEIVRIRESEPGRPRYVAGLSDVDRQSFDNLLLLCVPHRRIIDQDGGSRPIDLLETWRAVREPGLRSALSSVRNRSGDGLADLLAAAFSAAREQTAQALVRFEGVDSDSARLIRRLADSPSAQRRPGTDHDIAALLAQMTDRLSALEDRLRSVAETLSRLEDRTTTAEPAPKRTNIGWTTNG
jgi:hypothetical protein